MNGINIHSFLVDFIVMVKINKIDNTIIQFIGENKTLQDMNSSYPLIRIF
jgi:hypothetical protein